MTPMENNWISVKDTIPPKGKDVLLCWEPLKSIAVGRYQAPDKWIVHASNAFDAWSIPSHWMYLPQLPKNSTP